MCFINLCLPQSLISAIIQNPKDFLSRETGPGEASKMCHPLARYVQENDGGKYFDVYLPLNGLIFKCSLYV